jgi:hypothetical protein
VQFNALGSAIWLQLDGEHTVDWIVQEVAKFYPNVNLNQITIDTIWFINYLVAHRLVVLDWEPLRSKFLQGEL